MGPLHDQVLDGVVWLFLGRDLEDDRVDFLPLGYFLSQVFFADLLGDEHH